MLNKKKLIPKIKVNIAYGRWGQIIILQHTVFSEANNCFIKYGQNRTRKRRRRWKKVISIWWNSVFLYQLILKCHVSAPIHYVLSECIFSWRAATNDTVRYVSRYTYICSDIHAAGRIKNSSNFKSNVVLPNVAHVSNLL